MGNAACFSSSWSYVGPHEVIFSAKSLYANALISVCVLLEDKLGFNFKILLNPSVGKQCHVPVKISEYLFNQLHHLQGFLSIVQEPQ